MLSESIHKKKKREASLETTRQLSQEVRTRIEEEEKSTPSEYPQGTREVRERTREGTHLDALEGGRKKRRGESSYKKIPVPALVYYRKKEGRKGESSRGEAVALGRKGREPAAQNNGAVRKKTRSGGKERRLSLTTHRDLVVL